MILWLSSIKLGNKKSEQSERALAKIEDFKVGDNLFYYMASSVSGQDEPNRALWLATRAGKMEPSCQYPAILTSHLFNSTKTKSLVNRVAWGRGAVLNLTVVFIVVVVLSASWIKLSLGQTLNHAPFDAYRPSPDRDLESRNLHCSLSLCDK